MRPATTTDRVIRLVAEQLCIAEAEVKREQTFVGDLGCDSLDTIELAMAVEDEFGLQISDETIEGFKTVGDVIDHVTRVAA